MRRLPTVRSAHGNRIIFCDPGAFDGVHYLRLFPRRDSGAVFLSLIPIFLSLFYDIRFLPVADMAEVYC